jgi:hypothetical protein
MAPNPMKPTCLLIIHLLKFSLVFDQQTLRDQLIADINGMLKDAGCIRKKCTLIPINPRNENHNSAGNP